MAILEHRPSGRHRIGFYNFKSSEVLTTKYKPNYILWDLQLNKYVNFNANYRIIITKETLFASVIKTILYRYSDSYNLVFDNRQFLFYSGVVLELYVNDYEITPIRITSVKAVIMYEKGKNVYINKTYRNTPILKAIFKYCQPLDDVNEIYSCADEINPSNFYLCSPNRLNITRLQELKENVIGSDDSYLLTLEPVLQSSVVEETLKIIALLDEVNQIAGTIEELPNSIEYDALEINADSSYSTNIVNESDIPDGFTAMYDESTVEENTTIEEEIIEYVETTTYNQIVSTDNTVTQPVRIYDLQSFSNLISRIPTHD
jgi:hypothetical protein